MTTHPEADAGRRTPRSAPPEDPQRGDVQAGARPLGAAQLGVEGEIVDAVAGSEFVDDRIRLEE